MKLRNVIYKTENIILQKVKTSSSKTCIIMGSGYSLSVDANNIIIHKDPLFFPPSGKKYGNYTVLSLFYSFECKGLDIAGKELANYINKNMNNYENIILHGHSKCGSCFVNLTKYLKRRVSIVSVSAPLNKSGTPITNQAFDTQLNWIEKIFFHKIFSNHNVDKDLCENSDFLSNLDLHYLNEHRYKIVVSRCGKFTLNPAELLLTWIDKSKGIYGDGIIPIYSQIPRNNTFTQILATHVTSMNKSIKFVKSFL